MSAGKTLLASPLPLLPTALFPTAYLAGILLKVSSMVTVHKTHLISFGGRAEKSIQSSLPWLFLRRGATAPSPGRKGATLHLGFFFLKFF